MDIVSQITDVMNEIKAVAREEVNRVLKTLSYRDREIIKLRLGLGDGYVYTPEEVAHVFKIPTTELAEIEKNVLARIARILSVRIADVDPLAFLVDPGTSTKEELADLLLEISRLYKVVGGKGIQFSVVDVREPAMEGQP